MTDLLQYLQQYPWWPIIPTAIALFSAITAITPTPKQGSVLAKIYAVIDFLALNIGKAKQTGVIPKKKAKRHPNANR